MLIHFRPVDQPNPQGTPDCKVPRVLAWLRCGSTGFLTPPKNVGWCGFPNWIHPQSSHVRRLDPLGVACYGPGRSRNPDRFKAGRVFAHFLFHAWILSRDVGYLMGKAAKVTKPRFVIPALFDPGSSRAQKRPKKEPKVKGFISWIAQETSISEYIWIFQEFLSKHMSAFALFFLDVYKLLSVNQT